MANIPYNPKRPARPITHTYVIKSTDPLIGFISAKGAPMVMPKRFSRKWKGGGKTLSLVTRDDVRIFMEEIETDG